MPRNARTPAEIAPEDHLEDAGEPAAKPARKKLRAAANVATFGHFGAAPKGATHWGVRRFRPDGGLERVGGPSPDGSMIVYEWPLEELDDSISTRLSPGKYKLEWIGDGAQGARAHLKWGREFEVAASRSAPIAAPATSSTPSSPIAGTPHDAIAYMREMRALARDELETIERQVNGRIGALAELAAVMRPTTTAPAIPPELTQALTSIGTVLERLEQRVDALESGGDDDEEEDDDDGDEDDEDEGEGGAMFKPQSDKHGDVAVAAGLNKLMTFLDGLAPSAAALAAEVMQEKAAEIQKRREAAHNAHAPHALNGHAPATASTSSSPSEASEPAG